MRNLSNIFVNHDCTTAHLPDFIHSEKYTMNIHPCTTVKNMDDSKKQQPTSSASSGHVGDPPNLTVPRTRKKRWHFKNLIAAVSLGALIIILYLLRSVFFPNYAGLVVALCCVAIGLFLVRGVIHMLLDFDKVEEAEINKKESKDLPLEANAVVQETGISPQTSDIKQNR